MQKINNLKSSGKRKFVTGESRYCQKCGKESHDLFEIIPDGKIKNKLQYCKKCFKSK